MSKGEGTAVKEVDVLSSLPWRRRLTFRQRAVVSFASLALFSFFCKLWETNVSDTEQWLAGIARECDKYYALAKQHPDTKAQHLGVCLGLAISARIVASDERIEQETGIHMPSYVEKVNRELSREGRKSEKKPPRRQSIDTERGPRATPSVSPSLS